MANNLRCSAAEESEDTLNAFTPLTGYEPKLLAFDELYDSSVPFSLMIPSSDQDVDDVTLGEMLTAAHRGQVDYCVPGGVSVSQLSSSVRSDGSGQPDGEGMVYRSGQPDVTRNVIEAHSTFSEDTRIEYTHDRSGKPDERNSSNAQIRTLLEEQRQTIFAEYREKVGHHELQASHAEEDRRILQGQLWRQKLEFREARQQSLTAMEELRKFQSSTFDTIARRKLIEDQNTILGLSGRVQELQNEVNCMSGSQWKFPRYQLTNVIHPKDRNCEICERTKITRAPCRRRIGGAVLRAENFGDLITADHKVLSEGCESRKNYRFAVVVQDLATQWIQSFPCKTKTSQDTQRSLQKLLETDRKPKVIYTDNSLEFGKVCEDLSWNHCTDQKLMGLLKEQCAE